MRVSTAVSVFTPVLNQCDKAASGVCHESYCLVFFYVSIFFLFLVWYDKHFNISNLLKKNQTKTQALDDEELGDSEV